MDFWQSVTYGLISQAILLVVLAFLIRSLLSHLLSKDLERFQGQLRDDASRAIESFKANLERQAIEHQIRFQRLHEKRAVVIAALHDKLIDAKRATEHLVNQWNEDNQRDFPEVKSTFHELRLFLERNRLYLTHDLCERINSYINTLWSPAFGSYVWSRRGVTEQNAEKVVAAFEKAQSAIEPTGPISTILRELEEEFRGILGVEIQQKWL